MGHYMKQYIVVRVELDKKYCGIQVFQEVTWRSGFLDVILRNRSLNSEFSGAIKVKSLWFVLFFPQLGGINDIETFSQSVG